MSINRLRGGAESRARRLMMGFGAAVAVALGAVSGSLAQSPSSLPANVVAPPLSYPKAQYFKSHPQAWAQFVAGLPRVASDTSADAVGSAKGAATGPWQLVTPAPSNGLCNPLLLTDATVMVHDCDTPVWYKLTPDTKGNYAGGTWTQIASLPVIGTKQYAPQYHASAVLPDGRVIIMGGEYNGSNTEVWTNLGDASMIRSPISGRSVHRAHRQRLEPDRRRPERGACQRRLHARLVLRQSRCRRSAQSHHPDVDRDRRAQRRGQLPG